MANLKITLVKSLNGRIQKHKANAAALGLKKIGDSHRSARQPLHPRLKARQDRLPGSGHRRAVRRD